MAYADVPASQQVFSRGAISRDNRILGGKVLTVRGAIRQRHDLQFDDCSRSFQSLVGFQFVRVNRRTIKNVFLNNRL
jgi:hypothetical protein